MKKLTVMISLILIILVSSQPGYADLYQDGVSAYRNGDYKLAEYYFKEAVQIFPENVNYRYYLAITLVQRGNIYGAEEQYTKVIELAPGSEAAKKARRGIVLISNAKTRFSKDPEPVAMANVATAAPRRAVIKMTQSNNAIIVPNVVINGRLGVNFILDTGATYTSISRQAARDLGIDMTSAQNVTLKTANGIIQVPRVVLKSININGVEANNVEVTIHDVPAAKNITGLLGLSFLDKFTVTIDKKNHRLILESL
jgi:clan AA aspartic protease (TIGR02281 family)